MKFMSKTGTMENILADIETRGTLISNKSLDDMVALYSFEYPFLIMSVDANYQTISEDNTLPVGRIYISGSESTLTYFNEHIYGFTLYKNADEEEIDNLITAFFQYFDIQAEKAGRNDWIVGGKKLAGNVNVAGSVYWISFFAKNYNIDEFYNIDGLPEDKLKPSQRMTTLETLLGRIPTKEEIETAARYAVETVYNIVEEYSDNIKEEQVEIYTPLLEKYSDPIWNRWGITKIIEINKEGYVVDIHDDIPTNLPKGHFLIESSSYTKDDLKNETIQITEIKNGNILTAYKYLKI